MVKKYISGEEIIITLNTSPDRSPLGRDQQDKKARYVYQGNDTAGILLLVITTAYKSLFC